MGIFSAFLYNLLSESTQRNFFGILHDNMPLLVSKGENSEHFEKTPISPQKCPKWSAMFTDMLHQKHWRLKLSPVQWVCCCLKIYDQWYKWPQYSQKLILFSTQENNINIVLGTCNIIHAFNSFLFIFQHLLVISTKLQLTFLLFVIVICLQRFEKSSTITCLQTSMHSTNQPGSSIRNNVYEKP